MPKKTTTRKLLKDGKPLCYKFRTLPKDIIELLGWQENDEIEFKIDYENNNLVLINKKNRKQPLLNMFLIAQDIKYKELGKKKYNALLQQNMTPDAKKALHEKQSNEQQIQELEARKKDTEERIEFIKKTERDSEEREQKLDWLNEEISFMNYKIDKLTPNSKKKTYKKQTLYKQK